MKSHEGNKNGNKGLILSIYQKNTNHYNQEQCGKAE